MDGAHQHTSTRIVAIDVAKALACLAMIQTHAYDAWVSPLAKMTSAYGVTRVIGTLPLPAFLLLSGMSFATRIHTASIRNEAVAPLRIALLKRGGMIILAGYALSFAYAALDGWPGWNTVLRADVLHVIGLSMVTAAVLGLRTARTGHGPDETALQRRVAVLGFMVALLCPWLTRFTYDSATHLGPFRFAVAPFLDVHGITRMPLVPLFAWFALGVLLRFAFVRRTLRPTKEATAVATTGFYLSCLLGGLVVALAFAKVTSLTLDRFPGTFSRTHVVVWPNLLDLSARAVALLGVAGLVAASLPPRVLSIVRTVGEHSLFIYAVHIPFCYGIAGKPLQHALTMPQATASVAALMVACVVASLAKQAFESRKAV